MRRILPIVAFACGILTFVIIAFACRDGGAFGTGLAAVACTMAVIAADVADTKHSDTDDVDC
jgi:hypothetical protein